MANINTSETENYSETDRVIELMRSMSIENQRLLLTFVDGIALTNPPEIDTTGALIDCLALADALMHLPDMTTEPDTRSVLAGILHDKITLIREAQS